MAACRPPGLRALDAARWEGTLRLNLGSDLGLRVGGWARDECDVTMPRGFATERLDPAGAGR